MTQTTTASRRQHTLPPRLSTANIRVLVFSVALALGGVMLYLRHVQTLPTPSVPVHVPVWTMIAAFAAAEVFVVYLHFRDETHAFSFGEIPLIVGLFLLAPGSLIAVNLVGSALALLCLRPLRPLKVLFNLSHFALEACLAVLVFHAIASSVDPLHPLSWLAAYGAALVSDLVGAVAIQSVIVIHQGRGDESFLPVLASAIVSALTNTSLGLVAVMLLWVQPVATLMLFVVAALVVMAYRGYTRQQRQLQDLQVFNDFTRAVTDVSDPAVLLHSLLTHARDALRARAVEIVLPGAAADEPWTHATLDERDGLQVSALQQLGLLHASDGSAHWSCHRNHVTHACVPWAWPLA